MVVEGKPGPNGRDIGRNLMAGPEGLPDLQIQASRDLGNGSSMVCDTATGGVPAIDPPSFDTEDPTISNALLDYACRFQAFTANEPCTLVDLSREHKKIHPEMSAQFCAPGSGKTTFPSGDTLVTLRLRDVGGEVGPVAQIIVRVASPTPTPP